MEFKKSEAQFIALSEKEKDGILFELEQIKCELRIWKKGESGQEKVKTFSYCHSPLSLVVHSSTDLSDVLGHNVLIHFLLDGRLYFSSGTFQQSTQQFQYQISLSNEVYKCERRKELRFKKKEFDDLKILFRPEIFKNEGLVVDFPRKKQNDEHGIFKEFLELIKGNPENNDHGEYQVFDALDVSPTGISFIVNDLEQGLFQKGQILKHFHVRWNKVKYKVEKGKIISIAPYKDFKRPKSQLLRIGINFLEFSEEARFLLSKQISSLIEEDNRAIFEEFMK